MSVWNDVFNEQPPDSQSPSLGDDRIRETRHAVYDRLGNEHDMFPDGTNGLVVKDGRHKPGTAVVFTGEFAPTEYPNGSSLDEKANGRLWFNTDSAQMYVYLHVSSGNIAGNWNIAAVGGSDMTVTGNKTFDGDVAFTGSVVLPVLSVEPASPEEGQIWLVDD